MVIMVQKTYGVVVHQVARCTVRFYICEKEMTNVCDMIRLMIIIS